MTSRSDYYVYFYLRADGTPYYIGKGRANRAYSNKGRSVYKPTNDRIYFPVSNLTEAQAFEAERKFIKQYGRKDNGTGILHNRSDGGEGPSGAIFSEETKKRIGQSKTNPSQETRMRLSAALKGKKQSPELIEKRRKSIKEAWKSSELRKAASEKMKGNQAWNKGKKMPKSAWNKGKIRITVNGRYVWLNEKPNNAEV